MVSKQDEYQIQACQVTVQYRILTLVPSVLYGTDNVPFFLPVKLSNILAQVGLKLRKLHYLGCFFHKFLSQVKYLTQTFLLTHGISRFCNCFISIFSTFTGHLFYSSYLNKLYRFGG